MTPSPSSRFDPHATDTLARMFDDVSPRYGLLNKLMSLGQDDGWRRALWAAVPELAHVVLDLCTGDGSSLGGLRRPGRLVIGLDASFGMLEAAAANQYRGGWAARLVCADAFRLPLRAGTVDAITIAFGMRNLRPQRAALDELRRVLRPGGILAVLEATAPRSGAFAPLHRFYLRRVVPLLGRLSPDPSAYEYLGASILEFGGGEAFTHAADAAGFSRRGARSFLLGATRLWVVQAPATGGEIPAGATTSVRVARSGENVRGDMPTFRESGLGEQRLWNGVQCVLSLALTVSLIYAWRMMLNPNIDIPLDPPRRSLLLALIVGGTVVFGWRGVTLFLRTLRPTRRN